MTPQPATRPRTRGGQAKRSARAAAPREKRGIDTASKAGAKLIDPNKPLTDKAKLFVRYWAQGESITTASARAGYSDNATFCYRLVHMPNVLALYDAEKKKYEEAAQMTRKKVMDGLLEGIEMAKMTSEASSVIAGWREIGKMCGYYEPVKRVLDINVNGNVVMQRLDRLSDAELLDLIQKGVAADPALLTHEEDDDEEAAGPSRSAVRA